MCVCAHRHMCTGDRFWKVKEKIEPNYFKPIYQPHEDKLPSNLLVVFICENSVLEATEANEKGMIIYLL